MGGNPGLNSDARLYFPATERNREPIAAGLEPLLPAQGLVLEIASGSGEHLCFFQQRFARSHPGLRWQGSDPDASHRASLASWRQQLGLTAMAPPLNLDASHSAWPELTEAPALVLCINMIHIAPGPPARDCWPRRLVCWLRGRPWCSMAPSLRGPWPPVTATGPLMPACGKGTSAGASVRSGRWSRRPGPRGCCWTGAGRCRPTTCWFVFGAASPGAALKFA